MAIKCRVLLFQFISIPGIYLKLFLMCFWQSPLTSESQAKENTAKAAQLLELPVLPGRIEWCRDG